MSNPHRIPKRTVRRGYVRALHYGIPMAGALLGGAVGIAAYTSHVLNGPRTPGPLGAFSFTPWEVRVPFEPVSFVSEDGVTLRGWWFPCSDSQRVVIGFTGHKGVKQDLLGIGSGLWRAGNNVLLFDFRGCGESDLAPLSLGHNELPDARAAVDYVEGRMPNANIGVVGFSMGAAIAILVAAHDDRIRAVVADSPFATINDVLKHAHRRYRLPVDVTVALTDLVTRVRYGYGFNAVRPIDVVDRFAPRQLLLIHGSADRLIPIEHAYRLQAAAGPGSRLWVVDDVPHCGAYFKDREAYVSRVGSFFEAALSPRRLPVEPASTGHPDSL